MLVIAGTIRLDPANQEAAVAAAKEIMTETHKEPGNNAYVFSADLNEPGMFRIFEEWETDESLQAHFKTPHMAAFQGAMGGFGITEMTVHKYEINSKGPLTP